MGGVDCLVDDDDDRSALRCKAAGNSTSIDTECFEMRGTFLGATKID
jgi:hypothetical protein